MLERRQLAEELGRLDPRDREVLDLSLRRRVPDEDLGEVFGGDPGEVARMRAGAIERLSKAIGVDGGSELGHLLKLLLEQETWALVAPAPDLPGGSSPPAVPPAPPATAPEPASRQEPAVARRAASPDVPAGEPVLGMLGGSEDARPRPARWWRIAAGVGVALALVVPAGVVTAIARMGGDGTVPTQVQRDVEPFQTKREAVGDPFPTDSASVGQYPIAYVRRETPLYDRPDGKVRVRVPGKTEWDSPRVLGVKERRGRWLSVTAPELENGEQGWVRDDEVARVGTVSWALKVDLSKRLMSVQRDGKEVRRVRVGVGREGHDTPTGRYSVTDKLRVSDPGSPYGCCVLALSGHQEKLPEGWPGGDRLAVHATADLSGLGNAVSLGCLRTDPRDTRWLLDRVPLGTAVFVSA